MDGAKTVQYPPSQGPFAQIDRGYRHRPRQKRRHKRFERRAIDLPALANPDGQVVGFSARKLKEEQSPNTSTRLAQESSIKASFYNYHNAKNTARHDGYVYVLEGFMDVMALDKAGIPSAVR
jgi:DNA primase